MVKFRVLLSLLVLAGFLAASAPASAQINTNGFSFGTTFILSKVDDGSRFLLTVFGFYADGSGFASIDVKCPVHDPRNLLDDICGALQDGDELEAMSGHPPDTASDNPNHYLLRSVTEGTPIVVSLPRSLGLEPNALDSWTWPAAADKALRPRGPGVTRDAVAA